MIGVIKMFKNKSQISVFNNKLNNVKSVFSNMINDLVYLNEQIKDNIKEKEEERKKIENEITDLNRTLTDSIVFKSNLEKMFND